MVRSLVGTLLEVGTGFHPELTGRENVYLNGAILGMTKAEVDRKFDEIVAFSGIEKFIDTPVKRYSSGMKVRLGFAVAAHLEPEILLVDEVLAAVEAELLPNRLCQFLFELSQKFNQFYDRCPVLQAEDPQRTSRLVLCHLTAQTLKLGLSLLGISTLERM